jgi:hypothetical protein
MLMKAVYYGPEEKGKVLTEQMLHEIHIFDEGNKSRVTPRSRMWYTPHLPTGSTFFVRRAFIS